MGAMVPKPRRYRSLLPTVAASMAAVHSELQFAVAVAHTTQAASSSCSSADTATCDASGLKTDVGDPEAMAAAQRLRIDRERLWDSIIEMGEVGGVVGPRGSRGVQREALTNADMDARRLLDKWAADLGLEREDDEIGNTYYRRLGQRSRRGMHDGARGEAIAIGSHLDSEVVSGRFGAVLGLLAGLEVLRVLHDHGVRTMLDVEIVNWVNEKGSRFPPQRMGSQVAAGLLSVQDALASTARVETGSTNVATPSFADDLRRHGFAGTAEANVSTRAWRAYIEPRIEEGTELSEVGAQVGVLNSVPGERILAVQTQKRCADPTAEEVLAVHVRQASLTIPSWGQSKKDGVAVVNFSVQMRSSEARAVDEAEMAVRKALERVALRKGCPSPTIETIKDAEPLVFDKSLLRLLKAAAVSLGQKEPWELATGGNDVLHIARRVPAALLFVPGASKGGGFIEGMWERATSHDLEAGVQVLLQAVLRLAGVERVRKPILDDVDETQ